MIKKYYESIKRNNNFRFFIRNAIILIDFILSLVFFIILLPVFIITRLYVLFKKNNKVNTSKEIIAYIISSAYTVSDMNKKTNSIEHLISVINPNRVFDKIIFNFFPGKENIYFTYRKNIFLERRQLFKGTLFQLNGLYFIYSIVISLYYCLKHKVNFIYAYDPHGSGLLAVIVSKILNLNTGMSQGTDYWATGIVQEFVKPKKIRKLIEQLVYKNIDIIEIPHSYIDSLSKLYGEKFTEKFIPYHFPIDMDYINLCLNKKSKKVDTIIENLSGKKIILTVSRISPEKYYEEYIKLAKKFKKQRDIVFLYVGFGPEEDKFKTLISEIDNFIWIPKLSNQEVIYLYSKIDIFIAIYVGMALREAMAVGCAIIGYNWDVIKYDLSNAGIQVKPFDIDEMSRQVIKLLDDNALRNELQKKAKQRAINTFSTKIISKLRRNRYEKLLFGGQK